MFEWHTILPGILTGLVCSQVGWWGAKRESKNQYKYKWTCPDKYCGFKVSSNKPGLVAFVQNSHSKTHDPGDS